MYRYFSIERRAERRRASSDMFGGLQQAVSLLGGESSATNILFNIARRGDVMEMALLLRRFPTGWETRDSEGCTALHAAASAGAMDMGQLLIRAGAGVRDADKDGWEALHYACANGHYGMAAWLLQSGADLSARTNEGWQPLHVAAHTGQTQLARYLSSQGADLRTKTDSGQEAVHLATDAAARDTRAVDFVQWLLRVSEGSVAFAQDNDGWQPVHNAAHSGALTLLKLLLNPPAPAPPSDLHAATADGCTPLHLAAIGGHLEAVQWLVSKGVDVNALTADGLSARALASLSGHQAVVEYLATLDSVAPLTYLATLTAANVAAAAGGAALPSSALRHRPVDSSVSSRAALLDQRSNFSASVSAAAGPPPPGAAATSSATSESAADSQFYLGLSAVLRRTEYKAAQTIQRHYRFQRRVLATHASMVGGAVGQAQASARLARVVRAQAARYVDTTLSRALLIKHLKLDLATLMEKGRVYTPLGMSVQLVTWRLRFFFCNDIGLCYQKVANNLRPCGVKRLIPWAALRRVEALQDDSIFIETTTLKKYYLQLKGAPNPALAAWKWATRLCQLAHLHGRTITGYVASAALSHTMSPVVLPAWYDTAMVYQQPEGLRQRGRRTGLGDNQSVTTRSDSHAAGMGIGLGGSWRGGDGTPFNAGGGSLPNVEGVMSADGEDEDEGEETAEEAYRRRQWILHYISVGMYTDAEDIGWDGQTPPDPRLESSMAAIQGSTAPLIVETGQTPSPPLERVSSVVPVSATSWRGGDGTPFNAGGGSLTQSTAFLPAGQSGNEESNEKGNEEANEDANVEGVMSAGGEDEDEGEETAEEAYRRRQWILHYISVGMYTDAEDIGWDGQTPPDPRLESSMAAIQGSTAPLIVETGQTPSPPLERVSSVVPVSATGAVGSFEDRLPESSIAGGFLEDSATSYSAISPVSSSERLSPRAEAAGAASSAAAASVPGSGLQTPGTQRDLTDTLPLPPSWKQAKAPDGRHYYYLKRNQVWGRTTRWTRPSEPAPAATRLRDGRRRKAYFASGAPTPAGAAPRTLRPPLSPHVLSLGWLQQRMSQMSMRSSPSASGTMTPISGVASFVSQSIVALAVAASSVASVVAASSAGLAVAA